jgi:hypothetical protein
MMNLYFTKDEMKSFLIKEGYTIKTIKAVKSYNTYHNRVEDNCFTEDVALKDELKFTDPNESHMYMHIEKYRLERIFLNVIKNKLLQL